MNTLNESQILTLKQDVEPDINDIAGRYCGHTIYVSWPHLVEARVVSVASNEVKYTFEVESYNEGGSVNYKMDGQLQKITMTPRDVNEWRLQEKEIRNKYSPLSWN